MKKHMLPLLLAAFFALSLAACNTQETGSSSRLESAQESSQLSSAPSPSPSQVEAPSSGPDAREGDSQPSAPEETLLQIAVGGETFLADLADTAAAQELASMLPISLVMADQNGVVKCYDLPSALPEAAEDFSSVPAGQLVLEGTGRAAAVLSGVSRRRQLYAPGHPPGDRGPCPGLGGGERGGDAPAGDRVKNCFAS